MPEMISGEGGQSPKRIEMAPEDAYSLERIRILHDVQEELLRWIKRRFWIGALLLAGITFVGITATVNLLARGFLEKEISRAQSESLEAVKAAALTRKATDDARLQTDTYARTVGELQIKAQTVDGEFFQVRQRLEEDTRNVKAAAKKEAATIADRLVRLERLVTRLASVSGGNQDIIDAYKKDVTGSEAAAQAAARQFADNSQYRVTVYAANTDLANRAVDELGKAGFKASSVLAESPLAFGVLRNTIRYEPRAASRVESVRALLASTATIRATEEGVSFPSSSLFDLTKFPSLPDIQVFLTGF